MESLDEHDGVVAAIQLLIGDKTHADRKRIINRAFPGYQLITIDEMGHLAQFFDRMRDNARRLDSDITYLGTALTIRSDRGMDQYRDRYHADSMGRYR